MTISHRASAGLAGQSASTTVTFTLPTGHTTDDLLIAWLGVKAYTVNVSSGTITTDYTAAGDKTSGTVANGTGVGSTHMYGRYRTHDGTESAPTCVTSAIASPSMAAMSAYSKTEAGAWDIATTVGADTAASGASVSITSDATLDLAAGDTLVFGVALPDDTADMGSIAVTATGITFGTITQRLTTTGTTSGNDAAMRVYDVPITAGSGTVTVTVTATNTNSGESEAAAVFLRLREPASGNGTVNGVAAPSTLGSTTAHSVAGGAVVSETAATETLGSTTAHSIVGGAVVNETAATETLGSTAPTITGAGRVDATAATESFGTTTAHTITGGTSGAATVNATAATATLGSTAPTVAGGAVVNATAGPETLNSGTHTITGVIVSGDATVNATAAPMTFDTTNLAIDAAYYAYVAEMTLGVTSPTIIGGSPDASVTATCALMTLDLTSHTILGVGPTPVLVRLQSTSVGNFHDVRVPRPSQSNEWVGLWPRLVFPAVQKALLLWEDGRVLEVDSLMGNFVDTADQIIAGGTIWEGMSDSWQAEALAAAGYTLVPVEGA